MYGKEPYQQWFPDEAANIVLNRPWGKIEDAKDDYDRSRSVNKSVNPERDEDSASSAGQRNPPMKKRSLTTLILVTLTLVLSLEMPAQQQGRAEKEKGSASLERSLDRLGEGLKESVAIEFRQFHGARKTYVRLKHRDGGNISFQVSQVPSNPSGNQPNQPPPDLSYAEWRVNLSDLNIAEVKIEAPAKGDYRVLRFATIGGKESIKWTGFGVGDAGWVSRGWIGIDEKYATQVATALEQAITACRE